MLLRSELFFLTLFSVVAWILPNHYPPWTSFHSDALISIVLGYMVIRVFWMPSQDKRFEVSWFAVLIAGVAFVPIIQFLTGKIFFFGVAWINFSYLLGLFFSVLLGSLWEKRDPMRAGDFLFFSISLAALFSVGMQLYQWLQLDYLDLWINKSFDRPSANLGQPNQLASLLVLGVLGVFWGWVRGWLRWSFTIGLVLFFLIGLTLTYSRTGWLNFFIQLSVIFYIGISRRNNRFLWGAVGLFFAFLVFLNIIPVLADILLLPGPPHLLERMSPGARYSAWLMFLDAASQQPWGGYGWGQIGAAHLKLASESVAFGSIFEESHNLWLDLVLWNGIPIGSLLFVFLCAWIVCVTKALKDTVDLILLLFLIVLGLHSMLEYPLHYAYFLLPAGVVLGALSFRTKVGSFFSLDRRWTYVFSCAIFFLIGVNVFDYIRVEPSFSDLRFEKAKIHTNFPGSPPDVIALTQLREMIVFGRAEARENMSETELRWMLEVTKAYPSPLSAYKLAVALGMNGKDEEAKIWLKNLCSAYSKEVCLSAKQNWERLSQKNGRTQSISWPNK